jgi:hypothetical protein
MQSFAHQKRIQQYKKIREIILYYILSAVKYILIRNPQNFEKFSSSDIRKYTAFDVHTITSVANNRDSRPEGKGKMREKKGKESKERGKPRKEERQESGEERKRNEGKREEKEKRD